MTLRVDHSELEETDPHGEGLWLMTWKGEFFTGVAFTLHEDGSLATEIPFVDGCAHGRCVSLEPDGRITHEYMMDHGITRGSDRAWWPDGSLRWERVHGHPNYREQQWNQAGVRVLERDDQAKVTRAWYDDGTLRKERMGDTLRAFAPDGCLLFTTVQHARTDATEYEIDAMESWIEFVNVDKDWWYVGLGFRRHLVEIDRTRGVALSRRLLAGDVMLTKIEVAELAAAMQITELIPDLEAMRDDETKPGLSSASGRHVAITVGEAARRALARLRLREGSRES